MPDLTIPAGAVIEGSAPVAPEDDAATVDADSAGEGGPSSGCPRDMVLAGSTCIDATEVTETAYSGFARSFVLEAPLIEGCAWKTTITDPPAFGSTSPMTNVDWCDAARYCRWADKRLCTAAEWENACSPDGRKYPYGNTFEGAACNTRQRTEASTLMPVATNAGCVGGVLGLYDMSGNADEWVSDCLADGGAGADDPCRVKGGEYTDLGLLDLACDRRATRRRSTKIVQQGFRCCRDPG